MKKILIFLGLILMPLGVNADVNLNEIHNSISQTNELTIKSIPITNYKTSSYYKECMSNQIYETEEEDSNYCLNQILGLIVESSLKEKIQNKEKVNLYVSPCDYTKNTCDITLYTDDTNMKETYVITLEGEYDESISNKVDEFSNNLKKTYYLSDMSYINQLINYTNRNGFYDAVIYDNSKILNIFPEFKANLERNPYFDYTTVTLGVGGSPILYGSSSVVVIYYNGVAVGISEGLNYYTMQLVYVPNTTEDTENVYIEAAKKRIEEYLNNEDYEISLTYNSEYQEEYCDDEFNVCDVSKDLNYIFEDDKTYIAKPYTLKINDQEYFVGIVPVNKDNIEELEIKSLNYETGINIATNGSNVPLDTTLEVNDVTKEYEKQGFEKVYDISLYSLLKNGYITRIKDGVKVRIPISNTYNKEFIDIYHIKENGEKEEKYVASIEEIEGKKYAVFTTEHFSMYGIASEENPQTYDGICVNIVCLFIGLIGLIITKKYCFK